MNVLQFRVVGLMTSVHYQKAKLCLEKMNGRFPKVFPKSDVRGMMDFDWEMFIEEQRRVHRGLLWKMNSGVLVSVNGALLGDDNDLQVFLSQRFVYNPPLDETPYFVSMISDYYRALTKFKRDYVRFDFEVDGQPIGAMLFMLFSELLPITCGNFVALVEGDRLTDKGSLMQYQGCRVHRIVPHGWIQCGDISWEQAGNPPRCVYGQNFPHEKAGVSHDRRGVLSMASSGKDRNASQFFVTLHPASWMDAYYTPFGRLRGRQAVEGGAVLRVLERLRTRYERPLADVRVRSCARLDMTSRTTLPSRPAAAAAAARRGESSTDTADTTAPVSSTILDETIDIRDVPSVLTHEQFLQGLYSYTVPEAVLQTVLSWGSCALPEDYMEQLQKHLPGDGTSETRPPPQPQPSGRPSSLAESSDTDTLSWQPPPPSPMGAPGIPSGPGFGFGPGSTFVPSSSFAPYLGSSEDVGSRRLARAAAETVARDPQSPHPAARRGAFARAVGREMLNRCLNEDVDEALRQMAYAPAVASRLLRREPEESPLQLDHLASLLREEVYSRCSGEDPIYTEEEAIKAVGALLGVELVRLAAQSTETLQFNSPFEEDPDDPDMKLANEIAQWAIELASELQAAIDGPVDGAGDSALAARSRDWSAVEGRG